MTKTLDDIRVKALLMLLRSGIEGRIFDTAPLVALTAQDWLNVLDMASEQGVCGLAFDGYSNANDNLNADQRMDIDTMMEWVGQTSNLEQMSQSQYEQVARVCELFHENGLKAVVLKGAACAKYYPNAHKRFGGDFDFFLCGDYEKGNELILKAGGVLEHTDYKHAHLILDNLALENHRYCIEIRGSVCKKRLEKHLEQLLDASYQELGVDGIRAVIPCADFNALFLTVHAFQHFLTEGISLKQICDWALFLKAEKDNVDWTVFEEWTKKIKVWNFAMIMTQIAIRHLGLDDDLAIGKNKVENSLIDRVIENTLFDNNHIYNKTYKSAWEQRNVRIMSFLRNSWKFSEVYE